ncbi:MAG: hypothetical protein AAGA87_05530 [Pseudomonadota bacterium]
MRSVLFALLIAAAPAMAQEPPALRFVGSESTLAVSPDELVEVISVQDGDRFLIIVEMVEPVGDRFAELTEATEGDPLTVQLCGRGFVTITSGGRVDGGRANIPAPSMDFADTAAEVLRAEKTCSDILVQ